MMTYFELFELTPSFNIDLQQLKQTYLDLQQQYHPDIQSATDSHDAVETTNSELIGRAYSTLVNADSRAEYLLSLQGHAFDANKTIRDLAFLEQGMDWRTELQDAVDNADESVLNQLASEVQQQIAYYGDAFQDKFSEQNWDAAIDNTQRLKFLVKLLHDIRAAFDRIDNEDADFYV